ncbi:MAG: hypothetical protein AAF242_20980 [Bacteroidota bacterium]
MMGEVLDVVRDGVKVNVMVDTQSAIVLSLSLFAALSLALLLYAKLMR